MSPKSKPDNAPPAGPSCEFRASARARAAGDASRTRLHRFHPDDYTFAGVRTDRYKAADGSWTGVLRRTLAGGGPLMGDPAAFELRYFEIAPGGHTTRERHEHVHVVVCVRGSGEARVKGRRYTMAPLDTLYIPPQAVHQLMNPSDAEPFGFFCIVDAERDRPVPVDPA
jgi:ribulose-bisphosphate carboxylase large chain